MKKAIGKVPKRDEIYRCRKCNSSQTYVRQPKDAHPAQRVCRRCGNIEDLKVEDLKKV